MQFYHISIQYVACEYIFNMFCLSESTVNHGHVICKRNRRKTPEHIVIDVSIFMLLYLEGT